MWHRCLAAMACLLVLFFNVRVLETVGCTFKIINLVLSVLISKIKMY